jgi:signal transduction histidine kinase/CheY-like chemotaxis protein
MIGAQVPDNPEPGRRLSLGAAGAVLVLGIAVLVGWALNIPPLKSVLPGLSSMKVNTALALAAGGASLGLGILGRRRSGLGPVASALALLVGLIGLLTLLEYATGRDLHLDQLLIRDPGGSGGPSGGIPGRMGVNTALCYLLLSLGLLGRRSRRWLRLSEFSTIATLAGAFTALVGYGYSLGSVPGFESYTQMALHTALGIAVLCVGILADSPDAWVTGTLRSRSAGGTLARWLLPVAIGVPVLLGWLRLESTREGLFHPEFAVAMLVVAIALVFGGSIVGIAVMLRRTEARQHELELQLNRAQRMEAVGRLAGGIAHDFNNALTTIIGFCELLLPDLPAGHPSQQDVAEIRYAADHASGLTRQLLAFSRQQVLQPRVVDVNRVVTGVEGMLRPIIGEDIVLETALAPGLGRVRADPAQLEQVIANLVVNARDAMPHGGRLTLETHNASLDRAYTEAHFAAEPGDYVLLAVSDTGIGMDEETRSRIFEPFFTTKEPGKGTGLGLATVYGIVKQSGGYIWVYSEPGRGTTFKIYLPRVEDPADEVAVARPAPAARGTETILLAEDSAGVRRLVRGVLERQGYRVLEAALPEAALSLAATSSTPVRLLLTDVVMAGMDGTQLFRQLRRTLPDLRVLFMSGYADDAVLRHGVLEAGAAFIEKPFTPQALVARVREVLDA